MIAVIKTGGKQYKVKQGDKLKVEKLALPAGKTTKFETLLTSSPDGKDLALGEPKLGKIVEAKIVEHGLGKKTVVVKYKNKIRYKRTKGHRQPFTLVEIVKIGG